MKHINLIKSFIQLSQQGSWQALSKILTDNFAYENSAIKLNSKQQYLDYIKKTQTPKTYETLHVFKSFDENIFFHIFKSTYDDPSEQNTAHQVITLENGLISGCFLDSQFKAKAI